MRVMSFSPGADSFWMNMFWSLQNDGRVVRVRCSEDSPFMPGESFDCKIRGVEGSLISVRRWDRIMNVYVGSSQYALVERVHIY